MRTFCPSKTCIIDSFDMIILIYDLLNAQKERGTAVLFVGEDLDVLMALCDKILVLSQGRVSGIVDPRVVTKEDIGLLMTKGVHEHEARN